MRIGPLRKNHDSRRSSSEFWAPYSDMMAALLGVFVLLLIVTVYHLGKPLQEVESALKERKTLADQIRAEIGVDSTIVTVSKSGIITFRGDILFAVDDSRLTLNGRRVLSQVMPPILERLFDGSQATAKNFESQLERILIEGHADSTFSKYLHPEYAGLPESSYKYNLSLSQNRAFSVMDHLLNDTALSDSVRGKLKQYATASGRSLVDPIVDSRGFGIPAKSRRIEIKFQMKDKDLLDRLVEQLELRGVVGESE